MNIYRGRSSREVYLASLLYDSIDDNNYNAVKLLLYEKNADPNLILPTKSISSFHLAVGCDDETFAFKITRLILQNGGNPNVSSDDGLTPVHIAAAWGRLEILKILLNCGGDCEFKDSNYMTPINYALKESQHSCLRLLENYLPNNYDIFFKEKENCYRYQLAKIIVNNGYLSGEYELGPTIDTLPVLPKSDTTNYVLNWFETHIDSRGGKTFIKTRNSLGDTSNEELSLEDSENDKTNFENFENNVENIKVGNKIKENMEVSSESGILTLNSKDSIESDNFNTNDLKSNRINLKFRSYEDLNSVNTSSDYMTCSSRSGLSVLNRNLFAITDECNVFSDESCLDNNKVSNDEDAVSTDLSFVTVSEFYKYEDEDKGITLFEKRRIKLASDDVESIKTLSTKMSSLPETFEYDADTLRRELTLLGYEPGPITVSTKRVYLKKLYQLQKRPIAVVKNTSRPVSNREYSPELEKTLRDSKWKEDLSPYRQLEEVLVKEFSTPLPSRKWREGHSKSSFTYLLLDPRKTNDLPCRAHTMDPQDVWKTFLSAVFYIGKGKKTRPYAHLYEAVALWKQDDGNVIKKKHQTILDIWKSNAGVICLHVFQNIIAVEAYTREASMINALKMENLTNEKNGEFYGTASTWRGSQKRLLGTYLLYKAMTVFLTEGERQLYVTDVATA